MNRRTIPVAAPVFAGNEKKYVNDCLDSTWISSAGMYIHAFEEKFADFCEVKHAISVMNGTVALHLSMLVLGIGPGDEVIIPTFTYVATANCVTYVGAIPVFVDSEPQTWNIDAGKIEQAITPHTKAIIVVHIYGHPANMDPIMDIAHRHNLYVIEDAAEAHGAQVNERPVGSIGHIATFSFFGNKILTAGEGGMIVTNNTEMAQKMRQLKGQGVDPDRRYWFPVVGYNYRMTNIQAAIGLAQLEKVDWHLAQRRRIAQTYYESLRGVDGITLQPELPGYVNSYWMTSLLLDEKLPKRDWVMLQLAKYGIETRPFFYPMHVLPMYEHLSQGQNFPIANRVSAQGMSLPSSANLTEDDIWYVCESLVKVLCSPSGNHPS
jgi:perosamine synthetase